MGSERALFLISILHQTTTITLAYRLSVGCFLFQFYIKPQRHIGVHAVSVVVSYFNSTSNHNKYWNEIYEFLVVSYFNSTSNHNLSLRNTEASWLFLISILHQTTTSTMSSLSISKLFLISILHQTTTYSSTQTTVRQLFLISILHQTTTARALPNTRASLFLISILHQTTTVLSAACFPSSCFLFQFYIKPQHIVL